ARSHVSAQSPVVGSRTDREVLLVEGSRSDREVLLVEGSRSDREVLLVEGSRSDREALLVEGSRSDRLETVEFDHAAALRAASAEAESALRAAQAAPEVARIRRPDAAPAADTPSRFASMGVIDPDSSNSADLDEIL